jgi:hypothetical protein
MQSEEGLFDENFGEVKTPSVVLWKVPPGNCLTLNSIWEMTRRRDATYSIIDEVEKYLVENLGKKFRNTKDSEQVAVLEMGLKQNLNFKSLPPSEAQKYDRESLYYRYRILEKD